MPVQFVIDTFGVDSEQAINAPGDANAIHQLRQQISQHLKNENADILRIRFKSMALYQRFKDFEGLLQVLPTIKITPKSLYRDRVNEVLPQWLSNDLIVELGLLETDVEEDSLFLLDRILRACHSDLLSVDFLSFIEAVKSMPQSFWRLLAIPEIYNRFCEHVSLAFDFNPTLADLFWQSLSSSRCVRDLMAQLAYEQQLDQLKKVFTQLHLHISLPPKSLSHVLLKVPVITLPENEAKELPDKCVQALQEWCSRCTEQNPEELSDILALIIAPWPKLLICLDELIQTYPFFITEPLITHLLSFNDKEALQMAERLKAQIERSDLMPLVENASVDEVMEWSERYFDLLRSQFLNEQSVNSELNESFTDWIIKQSPRIARSNCHWKKFSERLESYLQQDYIVVVCFIDALSALNRDLLQKELDQLEHLDLSNETLFAPLPTLTEVGKMAVITGQSSEQLPSDQETAIRQRYQDYLPKEDALKVFKSWKTKDEHINDNTNLVVFFENRIDERLHECVSFEKHRKDITPIIKQTCKSIEKWRADAGRMNRNIVFFITADHGMTVVSDYYEGKSLGEVKERVFKSSEVNLTDKSDLYLLKQNKQSYIVPKKRIGLTPNARLTHGGLTPEEVLIPFVTLTTRLPDVIKMPLEIKALNKSCQRISDNEWQLDVELHANVSVKTIKITLESPFVCHEFITAISRGVTQKTLLHFSAASEQSGYTEITICLNYEREGANEVNKHQISCFFPESLIEKDAATKGFEDMFS